MYIAAVAQVEEQLSASQKVVGLIFSFPRPRVKVSLGKTVYSTLAAMHSLVCEFV